MTRSKAGLAAVAVTAAASLVLAGCAQQSNSGPPAGSGAQPAVGFPETPPNPEVPGGKPGGVFRLGITEPTAIDPYNTQESEGQGVEDSLFTGLLEVTPDGEPVPGVATDWSPNDTCDTWTFNLKPGTKFHNGEIVDAAAFKRGWERASIKDSGSEVSYHLDVIKGYDEISSGAATEMSGVNASNPNQLVVTLKNADCEFPLRTIHPVAAPMPVAAGPTSNTAFNDAPIGNGPFKMDGKWNHDQGIRLVRFDDYTAGPKAFLDAIEFTIVSPSNGVQLEYDGFVNGTFDWARMPAPLIAQNRSTYEPQGKWISRKTNATNYFVTGDTTAPLNSVDARKAVSMAIDRNAIAQGVFKGAQVPATSMIPAAFRDVYQEGVCDACTFNLDEAKKLAEKAGLKPGTEINLFYNTGAGHEEWTAAVRQQLEKNLGLVVKYSGVPFNDHLNNLEAPTMSGLNRLAWSADYPTPGNFMIPLMATSSMKLDAQGNVKGNNYSRYSNPEFDALVLKASATKDEAERSKLWQQAEQMSIGRDLALMPMFQRQQFRLVATDRFANINMDFSENPTFDKIFLK
ncbi:peptide ABC transporter substrate-binding protein [Pseudonocardia sp. TRM90224]|uniref:peptide ABC transporter substrate-binding protein n=1 Tax=Pseudonocardia sp. TRM90224 TaxID=2812678 RepID=UPI001E56277B|nr:ABC transporter substrate-binding protein [Pseudonocardia sp. TRM90224]